MLGRPNRMSSEMRSAGLARTTVVALLSVAACRSGAPVQFSGESVISYPCVPGPPIDLFGRHIELPDREGLGGLGSGEGTGPFDLSEPKEGRVLPEMMVAAVRAQSKTFTSCMAGQGGHATFAITIAADGSVLRVHPSDSNIAEAPMKCLIAAWFRAGFPPPIGSARARAVIPLVFK